MLRKLILAVLLLIATFSAKAVEYTDVYYNPAESGWGFFVVQSNGFQFLAFFIYGSDGKPTWYVALLTDNGTGTFTGPVGATTGTYFPLPWNPAQYAANTVGTATFQPIDATHATFTYTVNGIGTVTKTVQRQTLTPYMLAGNYSGSLSGSVTGCTNPAQNVPSLTYRFNLTVSQVADQSATLTFTIVDPNNVANNAVCTLSGALRHSGRLYQIANATYQCPISSATQANLKNLDQTNQGIEGHWVADDGGSCTESIHFDAVNLSDN
jgi:hypothetical protein